MKTWEFLINFTEICYLGSNWQYGSIGSDNGLVPDRQQAIIWTSDGLDYWRIYASLSPNELTAECVMMWKYDDIEVDTGNVWDSWRCHDMELFSG